MTSRNVAIVVRTIGDRRDMLLKAIDSIDRQGADVISVVVWDANSPIPEWVDLAAGITVFSGSKSRVRAMNAGLERATKGDYFSYIGFLDDDDILLPGHVVKLVTALESDKDAGVAYSDSQHVFMENGVEVRRGPVLGGEFTHNQLCDMNCRPNHCFMIRRELLATERCEESLGYQFCADDWDLWVRLSARTRFVHAPGVSAEYRIHGKNATLLLRKDVDRALALSRPRQARRKK